MQCSIGAVRDQPASCGGTSLPHTLPRADPLTRLYHRASFAVFSRLLNPEEGA